MFRCSEPKSWGVGADRWTLTFVGHYDYHNRAHYDGAGGFGMTCPEWTSNNMIAYYLLKYRDLLDNLKPWKNNKAPEWSKIKICFEFDDALFGSKKGLHFEMFTPRSARGIGKMYSNITGLSLGVSVPCRRITKTILHIWEQIERWRMFAMLATCIWCSRAISSQFYI